MPASSQCEPLRGLHDVQGEAEHTVQAPSNKPHCSQLVFILGPAVLPGLDAQHFYGGKLGV
jgi:hypothetical protein